ncbi:MAG: hypothetical protein QM765_36435 [Myxococcales bacterium]
MKRLSILALLLAGCTQSVAVPCQDSNSCGTCQVCSDGTCVPDTVSPACKSVSDAGCVPETDVAFCARQGKDCGQVAGSDNCRVARTVASCGTCPSGKSCGAGSPGAANVCGTGTCTPETDAAFCARQGKDCGQVAGSDNCGAARTVASCGTCPSGKSCGAGSPGTGNVCGTGTCTPETDEAFCARQGRDCGQVAGSDNCGAARTVASCGTCPSGKSCGAGNPGTANVCGTGTCTPETDEAFCARQGKDCGQLAGSDNCGAARTVASCGTCPNGKSCGAGGTANVCGTPACVPETDAAFCARQGKDCGWLEGKDNCGLARSVASCGTCPSGKTCGGGAPGAPNVCGTGPCTPETDAALCGRLGKDCGTLAASDNCNAPRVVASCGACTGGQTCGGGTPGTPNVCGTGGCKAESDTAFCARLGKDCGTLNGTDDCGAPRTVASCGTCASGKTCGAGSPGVPNVCGTGTCTSETDSELCIRMGKNCGTLIAADRCGQTRYAQCGTCASGTACGGTGVPNVCGCESDADFCYRGHALCGALSGTDNCGKPRTVASCGGCDPSEALAAEGAPPTSAAATATRRSAPTPGRTAGR